MPYLSLYLLKIFLSMRNWNYLLTSSIMYKLIKTKIVSNLTPKKDEIPTRCNKYNSNKKFKN